MERFLRSRTRPPHRNCVCPVQSLPKQDEHRRPPRASARWNECHRSCGRYRTGRWSTLEWSPRKGSGAATRRRRIVAACFRRGSSTVLERRLRPSLRERSWRSVSADRSRDGPRASRPDRRPGARGGDDRRWRWSSPPTRGRATTSRCLSGARGSTLHSQARRVPVGEEAAARRGKAPAHFAADRLPSLDVAGLGAVHPGSCYPVDRCVEERPFS